MSEGKNLGVTLIALVITIIVLLILSGVTVSTLRLENGLIGKTEEANFKNKIVVLKEELNLTISGENIEYNGKRPAKMNVQRSEYDDESEFVHRMQEIMPHFDLSLVNTFEVIDDKLVYIGSNEQEFKWAKDMKVFGKYNLKINYINKEGATLSNAYETKIVYNNKYSVDSPNIEGYLPVYDYVEGVITDNTEINIIYYAISNKLAYSNINESSCMVTGIGSCTDVNIVIPEEYNGRKVTKINANAFKNNTNIESITISKNIEVLGKSSFSGCTNLKKIIIYSENLGSIEEENFLQCNKLEEYVVNKKNNAYKSIQGILFSKDGTKLIRYPQGKKDEEYIVPDSVTEIYTRGIDQNQYMKKLVVPESVNTIGDYAVALFPKLETLIINAEKINGLASFCDNYYIKTLEIGHNVKEMKGTSGILRKCGQNLSSNEEVTVIYDGSIAEWKAIPKDSNWRQNSKIKRVKCIDGTITL